MTDMIDGAPYKTPRYPFHIDPDGDICDVNGWLVCCPAYAVWEDDKTHAHAILHLLNKNAYPNARP